MQFGIEQSTLRTYMPTHFEFDFPHFTFLLLLLFALPWVMPSSPHEALFLLPYEDSHTIFV